MPAARRISVPPARATRPFLFYRAMPVLALGAALSACAAPRPAGPAIPSAPISSKDTTMNATTAPAALAVDDLNQRVLRLIDSIRSRADLSPDHIQRLTGVDVEVNAEDPTIYGIAGPVDGQGRYSLVSSHTNAQGQVDSLLFSFEPVSGPAPCARVEDYRDALSQAGFSGQLMPAGHRGRESWYFTRDGVSVNVHVRDAQGAPVPGPCVASVVIGVYQ